MFPLGAAVLLLVGYLLIMLLISFVRGLIARHEQPAEAASPDVLKVNV
jgi:hypothetical protein